MLLWNYHSRSSAFLVTLVFLAVSSCIDAEQLSSHKKKSASEKGANKPRLPPIDVEFKEELDKVIEDEELSKSIAQYVEVVPTSHRSRSLIASVLSELVKDSRSQPKKPEENDEKTNSTTVAPFHIDSKVKLKRPFIKELIKVLTGIGSCKDDKTCDDAICTYFKEEKKIEEPPERLENCGFGVCERTPCPPCPIPDYCARPAEGERCPPKPECPCGDLPHIKGLWFLEHHRQDTETISGGPSSTTTTGRPATVGPSTTAKGIRHRTTRKVSVSGSTKKPPTRPSAATTTSKGPTSAKTTSGSDATTARPSEDKTKKIKETVTNSTQSKKIVDIDGKKTEFMTSNITRSNLEYIQLESGLKLLIKNETLIQYITDAIKSLPFRSGGLEGRLADRMLRKMGEDTSRWTIHRRGSARSYTYSTIQRNMAYTMVYIINNRIKMECRHCEVFCKKKLHDKEATQSKDPVDESECDKTELEQPTTTRAPFRVKYPNPLCKPCVYSTNYCPAPDGCIQYTCQLPPCRTRIPKTKKPKLIRTRKPRTTNKPTEATSDSPSPSEADLSPVTTSARPDLETNPEAEVPDESKSDPDFEEDDFSLLRAYESNSSRKSLDDMDPEHQIADADRFIETPCEGSYCEDQEQCGSADLNELTPKKKQSGYIVNGESQKYGEWPSYVRLQLILSQESKSLCGGVLISKSHVLTAGHCLKKSKSPEDRHSNVSVDLLTADMIHVYVGEHEIHTVDHHEAKYGVENICFSRKFYDPKDEGSRFDFAILTLDRPVEFNDYVQPACLPYKPFPLAKSKCFVVGLGRVMEVGRKYLSTARFVQKMPVSRKPCFNWGFNEHDQSRWCFSRSKGPGDTCNGDSGGPILCRNKDHKWYVMGLVSYGTEMCDGAESPGWVAVYTRVPALIKQIQDQCLSDAA